MKTEEQIMNRIGCLKVDHDRARIAYFKARDGGDKMLISLWKATMDNCVSAVDELEWVLEKHGV